MMQEVKVNMMEVEVIKMLEVVMMLEVAMMQVEIMVIDLIFIYIFEYL